jgi:hypothetical protein
MSDELKTKLLRYGELSMRKAREEITLAEIEEMRRIESELDKSEDEMILLAELEVKKNY